MRRFEDWLEFNLTVNKKIVHVDYMKTKVRGNSIYANLGYKTESESDYYWTTTEIWVEEDFTLNEFEEVCKKYNVTYSICLSQK